MSWLALVGQLVLWHAYHGAEERALDQAVAAYNARGGVQVRVVPVPNDAYTQKRAAAIPHGNGPDLFIASHESLGEWIRDGLVAPFSSVAIDEGAYLDGMVAPLRWERRVYGLPIAWKSAALYYRTDVFPNAPATTDDLWARRGAGYGLSYEPGSFYFHAAWLHAFGGQILESEGQRVRPRLSTDAGERALAWVQTQAALGRMPGDASATTAVQLFRDGKSVALISGPWTLGELPASLPWAVAAMPIVSETGKRAKPLLTVEGVFLSARAAHVDDAQRFATWLSTGGAVVRAVEGRQLVTARAAWEDPRVREDARLGAFRAQLAETVAMSTDPAMAATWEPAQEALRKALRGDASAHDGLLAADRRISLALAPPPAGKDPRPYLIVLGLAVGLGLLLRWRLSSPSTPTPTSTGSAWAYLSPAVVCLVLLVFVPFALGAGMSFFHYVPGPDGGRFVFVGLDNFIALLGSRDQPLNDPLSFYFTLVVTIAWTLVNITLHVVIGAALALLLRDPFLRLRAVYRVLLIVPWAMPSYITALVWKGMFHRQLGAINAILGHLGIAPVAWFGSAATAFFANVTTNVWLGFPFMMVVTLGALSRIPKEIEEAATLDGASSWQRLRYVILPLLRPALLPSVVLGAVWTFNMFNVVFLVSGGEPDGKTEILISQAYRWAFGPGRGQRYGYAAAYAVVIFVLLWAQSRLSRRLTEPVEGA